MNNIEVNGRVYRIRTTPTIVICVDGTAPAYFDDALSAGVMPALERMISRGVYLRAQSIIPSLTNPNNVSIITGVTSDIHGICGNYFYDPHFLNPDGTRGTEIMMDGPKYLRCQTILKAFAEYGQKVVAITAKNKLLDLFRHGWKGIAFSAEKAHQVSVECNGIDNTCGMIGAKNPDIYSGKISDFTLAAAVAVLQKIGGDIFYISLTDYVQHKNSFGSQAARAFMHDLDQRLNQFDQSGAVLAITADHGMNDKTKADGSPNVRYLKNILEDHIGTGARVILPITDPYIVHHGALGSYATIYLPNAACLPVAAASLEQVDGIELVLTREQAARRFNLPPDRIGDLIVLSDASTVLGISPDRHDLQHVRQKLRSHGGLHEAEVPLILNRALNDQYQAKAQGVLHNYDVFDLALNGVRD